MRDVVGAGCRHTSFEMLEMRVNPGNLVRERFLKMSLKRRAKEAAIKRMNLRSE